VLVSKDAGATWSTTYFLNEINTIQMQDSLNGVAGDADILLFTTKDGGLNWEQFYPDVFPLSVNRILRSSCYANATTGFVCGGKNFENGVLYRTDDGGENWNFTEYNHELRSIAFADELNGVMVGYGVVYRTSDSGLNWNLTPNTGLFYTGIAYNINSGYWASAFDGSILYSSNNGLNWTIKKKGSTWDSSNRALNCIAVSSSGTIAAAGPNGYITWSDNSGSSWTERLCCEHNDILSLEWINEQQLLATAKNGGLYLIDFS
jgi:photosystem II stability/assembly factor-like uncharacterized protein